MAEGGAVGFSLPIFVLLWFSIMPNVRQSKNYLESIDEKMHTHASDGSINGIRGWY